MNLAVSDAIDILAIRLGPPAKKTLHAVGFLAPSGRAIGLDPGQKKWTRLWFDPPAPPIIDGVRVISKIANGNHHLNGPLRSLGSPDALRVEIESPEALGAFLDWFLNTGSGPVERPQRHKQLLPVNDLRDSKSADGARSSLSSPENATGPTVSADTFTNTEAYRRERAILAICRSIENTVRYSNGQTAQRTIKNKELGMSGSELAEHISSLLERQGNRCALTQIPFDYSDGSYGDLAPSPDRIDSSGHYDENNIQVVCRFVNFWKSDLDNAEFRRLLALVVANSQPTV